MSKTNMYSEAKTWSPFKGCGFDCKYCTSSFKRQAKRQKHRCGKCYTYMPHEHPERLLSIPSSPIVFVAGNADIAFCRPEFMRQMIGAIKNHRPKTRKTYYLQSKRPECLQPFLKLLTDDFLLLTTLETNRDEGYQQVSKAPVPSERYRQFLALDYPRKAVTVEPVMDFDVQVFADWLIRLKPEYVWLGYDSGKNGLPEPTADKLVEFVRLLTKAGLRVKGKTLRGHIIPGIENTQPEQDPLVTAVDALRQV